MDEVKVPKKVLKMLERRTRYARELRNAICDLDNWCESIGLGTQHPKYEDACLCSDIRIFCEEGAGEAITLAAIKEVLSERKNKKCSK